MKCCGNCFWSFTQYDEEAVEGYDEFDENIPQAGDCCIGQDHQGIYCCSHHSYIEGMEEYDNYVMWDDKYLGPGYLIVSKLDDEIVKFIKISVWDNEGILNFYIRAFEKDTVEEVNQDFRKIDIKVKSNDPLYNAIFDLSKSLNGKSLYSVDSLMHGKNNLKVEGYLDEASLIVNQDVYRVKYTTDFVDVLVGDNYSCKFYDAFFNFYNQLSAICVENSNDNDIKQLLLKNKALQKSIVLKFCLNLQNVLKGQCLK